MDLKFNWNRYAELFDMFTFSHQRELLEDGLRFSKGKLLDLGCGVGKGFEHIPPEVEELVYVDMSPQMLKFAKRNAQNMPISSRKITSRIEDLDFESLGSFDSICLFNSLYACQNPFQVIENCVGTLSLGGNLIVANQARSVNLEALLSSMSAQVNPSQQSSYESFLEMNRTLMGMSTFTPRTYELCELESIFEQYGLNIRYMTSKHFYGSCPLIVGTKE